MQSGLKLPIDHRTVSVVRTFQSSWFPMTRVIFRTFKKLTTLWEHSDPEARARRLQSGIQSQCQEENLWNILVWAHWRLCESLALRAGVENNQMDIGSQTTEQRVMASQVTIQKPWSWINNSLSLQFQLKTPSPDHISRRLQTLPSTDHHCLYRSKKNFTPIDPQTYITKGRNRASSIKFSQDLIYFSRF